MHGVHIDDKPIFSFTWQIFGFLEVVFSPKQTDVVVS